MELPRLRLRRVFEHGPSFKVQRVGGPTLTIAKKALTPNLQAKLRKYAEGGLVGDETDADLMGKPAPAVEPAMQAAPSMEPTAPVYDMGEPALPKAEEVQLPPAPAPALVQGAGLEAARQFAASGDLAQLQQSIASLPVEQQQRILSFAQARQAVTAPVVEAPVAAPLETVPADKKKQSEEALNQFRASDMGEQALTQFRSSVKAAGLSDDEKQRIFGLAMQARKQKAAATSDALSAATAPVEGIAPGISAPTVTEPAPVSASGLTPAQQRVYDETFAGAKRLMGPQYAARSAMQAALATPAEAPAAPLVATPAEAVTAAAKGQGDLNAVATALTKPGAPAVTGLDEIDPTKLDEDTGKALQQVIAAKVRASDAALEFKERQARVAANVSEQRFREQQQIANDTAAAREKLNNRIETLRKELDQRPADYFTSMGFPQKVGSLLLMAASGFASGYAGTPDYVRAAFDAAMSREVEFQKRRRENKFQEYMALLGDVDSAEKLYRADLLNIAAMRADALGAKLNIKGMPAAAAATKAELMENALKLRLDVLGKAEKQANDALLAQSRNALLGEQTEATDALEKERLAKAALDEFKEANPQLLRGGGAAAGVTPYQAARLEIAKQNQAWKEENRARSENFKIMDPTDPKRFINIKAESPPAATAARSEMLQRTNGLLAIEKLDEYLSQPRTPGKALSPNEIKKIQAEVNSVVEQFGGALKGSKNLVTVMQARLAKEALSDVPVAYARYADLLGNIKTAMAAFRDDVTEGLRVAVNTAGRKDDPGLAEFNSKWTKSGFKSKPAGAVPAGKIRGMLNGKIGTIDASQLAAAKAAGFVEMP